MQRTVEAPVKDYSDVDEAAAWLGHTTPEFRSEVKRFPHLLPWFVFGKTHKWFWLDLVRYNILRPRESADELASPQRKQEPEKSSKKVE